MRFLGRRDDVPAVMAAADVFAMPSEWEPFGLVYAEAMAMALPVVALDNGGTVEVVEPGETGLLSAPDDGERSPPTSARSCSTRWTRRVRPQRPRARWSNCSPRSGWPTTPPTCSR